MFSFVKGLRKHLCFVKVFFQLNPAIKIIIHVATSMNIILDVPFTEDLEMRIFFQSICIEIVMCFCGPRFALY